MFKPDKKNLIENKRSIKEQANYQGDWTLLLRERLLDPITKEKFIKTKHKEIEMLKNKKIFPELDKDALNKKIDEILEQINHYDTTVEKVFSSTKIKNPKYFGPSAGISEGWGDEGTVFTYNTKNNIDKNMTEAHEKFHGIVTYLYVDGIQDIFDEEKLYMAIDNAYEIDYEGAAEIAEVGIENYTRDQNEIINLMSSLKNYFGMKSGDTFTEEHYQYALKHFGEDMSKIDEKNHKERFYMYVLKEENNKKFLEIINSYPI